MQEKKHAITHEFSIVKKIFTLWWTKLLILIDCAAIKMFLTWEQLLMTVIDVLLDWLKSNTVSHLYLKHNIPTHGVEGKKHHK